MYIHFFKKNYSRLYLFRLPMTWQRPGQNIIKMWKIFFFIKLWIDVTYILGGLCCGIYLTFSEGQTPVLKFYVRK